MLPFPLTLPATHHPTHSTPPTLPTSARHSSTGEGEGKGWGRVEGEGGTQKRKSETHKDKRYSDRKKSLHFCDRKKSLHICDRKKSLRLPFFVLCVCVYISIYISKIQHLKRRRLALPFSPQNLYIYMHKKQPPHNAQATTTTEKP